jgi:S1-C subfamily serine protease
VVRVLPGSQAEAAAVQVGDLVVAVGRAPTPSLQHFTEALTQRRGEHFTLEVRRGPRLLVFDM